jgi:cation diffusion facilitator CzcD-associated flavoprotein CzcO
MKKVCIVGCGATGLLLLYNLQKGGISPTQVIVIDPSFLGGDLALKWSSVTSNTRWEQLLQAVPYPGPLPEKWLALKPETPCSLRHYINYLKEVTKSYLAACEIHSTVATTAVNEDNQWKITLKTKQTLQADVLLLATGSEPKHMDLPYPVIPLPIALDENRLAETVLPGNHVLVFGTAHSATLIVRNLLNCKAKVTNFYASPKPFYFDKDGEYDGLKQEAAEIAEKILKKELPVDLVSVQDMGGILRHTKSVDAVIYAIGFEGRNPVGLKDYDATTGVIQGVSKAWGFGIAYPNKAPDGIHYDVSIPAFQGHIEKQMPNILSLLLPE